MFQASIATSANELMLCWKKKPRSDLARSWTNSWLISFRATISVCVVAGLTPSSDAISRSVLFLANREAVNLRRSSIPIFLRCSVAKIVLLIVTKQRSAIIFLVPSYVQHSKDRKCRGLVALAVVVAHPVL